MPAPSRSLLFYVVIGLIQGLVLLTTVKGQGELLGFNLSVALCAAVVVAGVNLQLLGSAVRQRGTGWLVLGLTLLISGISAGVLGSERMGWLQQTWFLAAVVLGYIGTAFILAWPTREGVAPRYEDLFRHAWNNVFILFLAQMLTGLFWQLLWLCALLFGMLGIPQVTDVVESAVFLWLVLPVVFSLGMRMGRENEKIIGLLRGILLTLCRFLLPLSALIAVLFTLTLPLSGLQPVWDTGYSTSLLLVLAGINLFLVNGVFQDGRQPSVYPAPLKRLVEASLVCLPVLVGLAAYASWLRIDQYGLTPSRIMAVLLVGVMLVHGLAAVWAVVASRQGWLNSLRVSNPWIALLSAVLIVLFYTPLLDPQVMSAKSQVGRLLGGRTPITEFDAGTLYRDLGQPGRAAFEQLEKRLETDELFDAGRREQLLGMMAQVRRPEVVETQGPTFEWLGPVQSTSESLADSTLAQSQCGGKGCYLWAVDLDGDGHNEVLMIPRHTYASSVFVFTWEEREWREVGSLSGSMENLEGLAKGIREGAVKLVAPRYKTLSIDGQELVPDFRR
ncbi:DUF4153 domain-containing protein [Pseudomonas mosselii]|uniref:DUF4153 domain-containing protein n=2 Tax=Pseudomonas mosselii TaxID=78327 RepID=UPI000BB4CAF2|nr:DUF4153 domain-containing protein [Pseudomonas mosselii]ATB65748.1 hypothetical protein CLJ08_14320 [Pseudomonas mosselii]MEA3235839.1 DUF4153 domain-containing protein [Pseudomonas mosselii]MEB5933737.1 DUF4153 domain-containing protein [Pseudomonas mosselii]UVN44174.1 DUF4153 domain-containing protein [Pseudomonas mosselii]UWS66969.1 DUF4153 domain-containing protein [Pseudomonas mosselii]